MRAEAVDAFLFFLKAFLVHESYLRIVRSGDMDPGGS